MSKKAVVKQLVQENIGIGKVIVHKKPYEERNKWWITFQETENKPIQHKEFDDYLTAWLWFTDNGGHNIKTVAANDDFLIFTKNWGWSTLEELGHEIFGISLYGMIQTSESKTTITVPSDCGYSTLKNAAKLVDNWETADITSRSNKRTGMITRYFNSHTEFDNFQNWLFTSKEFKGLIFYIVFLKTKAKNECYWKRERAKDGTQRMQLFLKRINDKLYTDLTFREVLQAAGDMAGVECELLDHAPGSPRKSQQHCRYAIERGDINIALNA